MDCVSLQHWRKEISRNFRKTNNNIETKGISLMYMFVHYEWSFNLCLLYMHDPGVLNDWKFMQVPFLLDHLVDLKFDKTNYNYIHAIKLGERNELK